MRDYKIYSKINQIIETRNKFLRLNEKKTEHLIFLGMFNYCANSMKNDYLFILENSYFKPTYQFWWLDYYCKSSYYRRRFTAVSSFVALFEMIYENFTNCSDFINFA